MDVYRNVNLSFQENYKILKSFNKIYNLRIKLFNKINNKMIKEDLYKYNKIFFNKAFINNLSRIFMIVI